MNKFIAFMLTLVLTLGLAHAKDNKVNSVALASLNSTLDDYKQAQIKVDVPKMMDYIYPKMFKIMSKKDMTVMYEEGIKGGKLPKILNLEHKTPKSLKTYSKGLYALVDYKIQATMDMTPSKEDKDGMVEFEKMKKNPVEMKKFKTFMKSMIKSLLGNDIELSSKETSMLFNIKKNGQYMALKEGKEWKFVDVTPQSLSTLESVLPKDLVKKEQALFSKKISQEEAMKKMMETMIK